MTTSYSGLLICSPLVQQIGEDEGDLIPVTEEAKIGEKSSMIGKTLIDSHLRKDYGVIIVAIKKISGEMIFNPMPTETLEAGDVIVVIGKKEDLKRMNAVL